MIKVTDGNSLVLTNISFGEGEVHSVINIDWTSIALCKHNGIEVYDKETQELTYKIPKHLKPHEYALYA